MQILTKEALLLLALSTSTNPDGLTMNEAVRALKARFDLTITESAARAAAKALITVGFVDNGVRKVPAERRVPAEHYRLTEGGLRKLRETIGVLNGIALRSHVQPQEP